MNLWGFTQFASTSLAPWSRRVVGELPERVFQVRLIHKEASVPAAQELRHVNISSANGNS